MNGVVGITHLCAIAGGNDLFHDVRRQQAWQTSPYIIADEPTAPFFVAGTISYPESSLKMKLFYREVQSSTGMAEAERVALLECYER